MRSIQVVFCCLVALLCLNAHALDVVILHDNDNESHLVDDAPDRVAKFITLYGQLKTEAAAAGATTLVLNGGDSFLPSPQLEASLNSGPVGNRTFFDVRALNRVGYDVINMGNHEFDLGPNLLAEFIGNGAWSVGAPPYISSNLNFSGEAALQALVNSGRIAEGRVLTRNGETFGIIGLTTPWIPEISSPGGVQVLTLPYGNPNPTPAQHNALAAFVQGKVNALIAANPGLNKIILVSHLQNINNERELSRRLRNVDIIVGAGGHELAANSTAPGGLVRPEDENLTPAASYPITESDLDGKPVHVITTKGEYRYVGFFKCSFNAAGEITAIDTTKTRPRPVLSSITSDATTTADVVTPVLAYIASLANNIIAVSEVPLEGRRSSGGVGVRVSETNEGNLLADALLWEGGRIAAATASPAPQVALQNGGGMRKDALITAGNFTELNTNEICAFSNFVAIVPNIPHTQFKEILEHSVSNAPSSFGGFGQIAGFRMVVDLKRQAQSVNTSGVVQVVGERVRQVVLNNGTVVVENGVVLNAAGSINIATNDFTAEGGDNYPFRGAAFISGQPTYQKALFNYIQANTTFAGLTALNGVISAARYPFPSEGRILIVSDSPGKNIAASTTIEPGALQFLGEAQILQTATLPGPGQTNPIGGLSGIVYNSAANNYLAISDDPSQNSPARFYTLKIDLGSNVFLDSSDVTFAGVTTLGNAIGTAFPTFGIDPEAIALLPGTTPTSVFIASEGFNNTATPIQPFVNQFNLANGRQGAQLQVPAKFTATGTSGAATGIRHNLAFEGLTVSPSGTRLFVGTEGALQQDGPAASFGVTSSSRIVRYNLLTGQSDGEFVYVNDGVVNQPVPPTQFSVNGLVELLALDDNTLLALERSFSVGVTGNSCRLYRISLNGATDVSGMNPLPGTLTAVTKTLLFNFDSLVPSQVAFIDNLEGMTFGPDLPDGRKLLLICSDNNFTAGQFTQFLAFAVSPTQVLLNEISAAPPEDEQKYFELKGAPNLSLTNVQLVALSGDAGDFGEVITSINLNGQVLGSSGLLIVGDSGVYTNVPIVTTFLNRNMEDEFDADSISFLLIRSATTIATGADFDANNDGVLDSLPADAVILDSISYRDGTASDKVYGVELKTVDGDESSAATRFVGDRRQNAAAWHNGDVLTQFRYDPTDSSANLPAGAYLTPGRENVIDVIVTFPFFVEEGGPNGNVVVNLARTPANSVDITVTADAHSLVSTSGTIGTFFSSAVLTFNSTAPQTIFVQAAVDLDTVDDETNISFAVTEGDGFTYPVGLPVPDITLGVNDNDFPPGVAGVLPTHETTPTTKIPPDADDPAFWVNPANAAQSLVICSQKQGGFSVYDLNGATLLDEQPTNARLNNVEVIYNFPLSTGPADIAVFTDRISDKLAVYRIQATAPYLINITDNSAPTIFAGSSGPDFNASTYGLATYRSPCTGKFFAFVSQNSNAVVKQLELTTNGNVVRWSTVRTITLTTDDDDKQVEGMVVDSQLRWLYMGQEEVGIFKLDAEPTSATATVTLANKVALIGENGLAEDVEGLTIYYNGNGTGYLLASSQGSNTFNVYTRQGANTFVGSFRVGSNGGIDATQESDGADVINIPLGPNFPQGLMVVQDGRNTNAAGQIDGTTNFKFVPWQNVQTALNLSVPDTAGYNPRKPVTDIREIQGAAHLSPLSGQAVKDVYGVVTIPRNNGYYMQCPGDDGKPGTSEGLFVFTSSNPGVAAGDLVLVNGSVEEFRPGGSGGTNNLTTTELSGSPVKRTLRTGDALPAPVVIGTGGRVPPTQVIDDDATGNVETSGTFDATADGIDFYESLEGMRVQVNGAVAVGPTNSFGEIPVVADNGTNAVLRTPRGGILVRAGDFNPERIILDDTIVANPPTLNVGDAFSTPVVGVMDYGFGNFKLNVTGTWPAATSNGNVREVTSLVSDPTNLTVATFNVENLDPSDPQSKFNDLALQIVNNLRTPDIIGLEEVQDNDGAGQSGARFSPGTRFDGSAFGAGIAGGGLVLNEIHADPSATAGDANGDGSINAVQDEFVEIVNNSTTVQNMSGMVLTDLSGNLNYTIPSGTSLNPGQALVIFGGGTPVGTFGGAVVRTVGTGNGLSLNNAGDTITLKTSAIGSTVFTVVYGDAGNDQSIVLFPELTGTIYAPHTGTDTSASQTYAKLIAAIQALNPSANYDYREIAPQPGTDGGEPGGNIRVAFLFRTNRVGFVDRAGGTATNSVGVTRTATAAQLTLSPGRIDPTNAAFNNSRKPLAGEFTFNGQTLFLIVNHFNSKGGDQPLFGRFQPPVLSSEVQRIQQATIVANFVQSIFSRQATANVIVLGDLNDFQFSPPLQVLKNVGLKPMIETLPENERYTYNFDGNAQVLDHIMVSSNLVSLATYDSVHCNSEFADQISDHDPSVVRLTLPKPLRFATFNCSLNRTVAGQLVNDLTVPAGPNLVTTPAREANQTLRIQQVKNVVEIIQRVNPDVVLLNEFDYDPAAVALLKQNFLQVSQNGSTPATYPYHFIAESNTGISSGFDLNNFGGTVTTLGANGYGDDCFGFGAFPGQFGMVLLSKYPIMQNQVRTFQKFLWKDMPGALLPDDPATPGVARDWYSPAEQAVFRLSSKSHWDVPINVNGSVIHALCSHPTPPVFDGPEDRNGTRNFDEIRFWKDYITGFNYMYDDTGEAGGLTPGAHFVILGDQNSDPKDGESIVGATDQLLKSPLVNTTLTPFSEGGAQQTALQGGANTAHLSDPKFDTADFADSTPGNLRADYVLPSKSLKMLDARVFWPLNTDPLFPLVGLFDPNLPVNQFPSSDHKMVWVDLSIGMPIQAGSMPNGISSGDVTATTAVVWTRTTAAGTITFDVSKEPGFANKTTQTVPVTATDVTDLKATKSSFTGLTPNTVYYYRVGNGTDTLTGTFKTAAAVGVTTGLRFGVSGDWRGELAPYPAIQNAVVEQGKTPLDFFVKLGDTIYADFASPASQNFTTPAQAQTVKEFRAKHAEVYGDRFELNTFGQLQAQTAILATIDDHEVTDDFAGGAPANTDPEGRFGTSTNLINTTPLFNNGLQAFQEYNAVRDETYAGGLRKLYRNNRYGKDAAVMLLDNRSFRDTELPAPNFADAASVAGFLNNSLTQSRTMLGSQQLTDLKADLVAAHAAGVTWKFVMVAEPIQNLGPVGAGDRFEGYAKERTEILKFINDNKICNVVFVAADIHGTVVNNLTYQTTFPGAQIPTGAFEITTGSVAFDAPFGPTVVNLAAGLGLLTPAQVTQYTGLPRAGKEAFLEGLLNGQLAQFGYDPIGLQNSPIDATLTAGAYTATSTYGWTEFKIDEETQELTVTTYGIDPYTATQLTGNPSGVTQRMPEIVSQFVVRPAKCVDLAVTKTNGTTSVLAGAQTTYTINITNSGPDAAEDVRVQDTLPTALTNATWMRAGAAGARTGTGSIDDTITLGAGQSATYTLTGTVSASATGSLANTAKVTLPVGVSDGIAANNSATDTDTILNSAPVAVNGSLQVNEDGTGGGTLVATDGNGNALTFSIVAPPTKGTVVLTNAATGAYTYKPNAGANGSDSFTFKANDGSVDSNVATVTITILSFNDTPTAAIGGSRPLTGTAGIAVSLSSQGTTDPDGTIATYAWFFGDGSEGSGASPTHIWAAAGTYTITLFVTDNDGAVSAPASAQVTINAGGPATPGDQPLSVDKALIKLSFAKSGRDSATFQGVLPVPDAFSASGKVVQVNVGGILRTFTMDVKGRARSGSDSFTLVIKSTRGTVSKQDGKFLLNLRKGDFATALSDEKLDGSADVKDGERKVKVSIIFNGITYATELTLEYSAKAGKTGVAKN